MILSALNKLIVIITVNLIKHAFLNFSGFPFKADNFPSFLKCLKQQGSRDRNSILDICFQTFHSIGPTVEKSEI